MPRNATPVSAKSSFEYWRSAEIMPSGMPTTMPISKAVPISSSEATRPARHGVQDGKPDATLLVAEVALDGLGQPAEVADRERLVQAIALDDDLAHLGRCRRARAG